MSQPYTAVGLTGTQNSPHMGAVFNRDGLFVCQTDTLARAERIAGFLNGDAERLEQAERIINEMGPVCMTVLMACGDSMGSYERTKLKKVIAEAATFVASLHSHV